MIELKSAIILGKNAPKEEISFAYDKGIVNQIDYSEKYKFAFLKLKDQALDKGEFYIDEVKIYPNEENEKTLFFLAVNSLIKFDLCFVVNRNEKKEKVKSVQDELIALRDMPTSTESDKNLKIAAIFDKISLISPSYLLLDYNDELNQNNSELVRQLDLRKDEYVIITLNRKAATVKDEEVSEEEFEVMDLSIGEAQVAQTQKTKKKKEKFIDYPKKEGNFFKSLWKTLKNNIMVFLSFVIPAIGVIAFVLLAPLYSKSENKVLIIPFIITIVICFSLYMLMTYKCTDFGSYKDKEANQERLYFFIINFLVTGLGYGLGFVIYILFKKFDTDISSLGSNVLGIVLSIVFVLVLLTACLYLYPLLSPLINKIKKKK